MRTRTDLSLLRAAVSDLKRETTVLPAALNDVRRGVYLRARGFPPALISFHPDSDAVQTMTSEDLAAGRFSDVGGWAYVSQGDAMGKVFVNCTHAEPGQQAWSSY